MSNNGTKNRSEGTVRIKRKYDEEFKRNALKMIENGQSVHSVSQALGVGESQLHKWKRTVRSSRSAEDSEVVELTKRLRQVEMERDILKKALSIFSRQS